MQGEGSPTERNYSMSIPWNGTKPLLTIRVSPRRWSLLKRLPSVPVLCLMAGVWGREKGTEPILSCDS